MDRYHRAFNDGIFLDDIDGNILSKDDNCKNIRIAIARNNKTTLKVLLHNIPQVHQEVYLEQAIRLEQVEIVELLLSILKDVFSLNTLFNQALCRNYC